MVILFMMQASKKVPFDDPMVLNGVRAVYVLSNLIIVGFYVYVQQQINKKSGAYLSSFKSRRLNTCGPPFLDTKN